MKQIIINKLSVLEKSEDIKVLVAVESGSRAWGFESPDSDYDVRFIYIRPKSFYLRLEKTRDVIESELDEVFDINGWDLEKALRLLHNSNPTLFEWFSSPIQYIRTEFCDTVQPYLREYFDPLKGIRHYLSTAINTYRSNISGETVVLKKYFYVLRPLLACRWIMSEGTAPPMLFSELTDSMLDESMCGPVNRLLGIKMNSPEIARIPPDKEINSYIEAQIASIDSYLKTVKKTPPADWGKLNDLFLSELEKYR